LPSLPRILPLESKGLKQSHAVIFPFHQCFLNLLLNLYVCCMLTHFDETFPSDKLNSSKCVTRLCH